MGWGTQRLKCFQDRAPTLHMTAPQTPPLTQPVTPMRRSARPGSQCRDGGGVREPVECAGLDARYRFLVEVSRGGEGRGKGKEQM